MKMFFNQSYLHTEHVEEELTSFSLRDSIQKTHQALNIAYAGFDNATDSDLIDSYIYEIYALQKRYKHLMDLAATTPVSEPEPLYQHSPIRTLVSHVFG